jgi:hypothetical protein
LVFGGVWADRQEVLRIFRGKVQWNILWILQPGRFDEVEPEGRALGANGRRELEADGSQGDYTFAGIYQNDVLPARYNVVKSALISSTEGRIRQKTLDKAEAIKIGPGLESRKLGIPASWPTETPHLTH